MIRIVFPTLTQFIVATAFAIALGALVGTVLDSYGYVSSKVEVKWK